MDFTFSILQGIRGVVPCGTNYAKDACTVCDFFVLIQNIINLSLAITVPLVTLAAVYIAFLFMFFGGSPSITTDAKGKLWLVLLGTFWVFGSWLVLNTILNIVANKSVFPWPWNQINCQVSQPAPGAVSSPPVDTPAVGTLPVEAPASCPGCTPFEGGSSGGGGAQRSFEIVSPETTSRLDNSPALPATDYGGIIGGAWEDAIQIDTSGYQAIDVEHFGLEQFEPAAPYTATDPTSPIVDEQVQQIINQEAPISPILPTSPTLPVVPPVVPPVTRINDVDSNLVKAIIQAESSGNKNAIHLDKDGKMSYGLMQVRPDTAKRYDAELKGLSDAQIGEKLKDPDYNVKLGTAYLQDLASKYNGDLDKVIAAYNGGPGANKPSVDCPGSMRWQCQWDNTAQTIPNTGYKVTRNYVVKVNNYYSQLSR